jgi:hypothetical protein
MIVTLLRLSPRQISDVAAFLPNQGWMDADQTLCVHKEIFGSLKTESQFSSFDFHMLVGGHLASAGACCGVQKGVRRYEPHGIVV